MMIRNCAIFMLATTAVSAFSVERRQFFGQLAGAAALVAGAGEANAALKTGASSVFTGDYDDPNHPGCLRQVKVVGAPLKGDGTRSAYPVIVSNYITTWRLKKKN